MRMELGGQPPVSAPLPWQTDIWARFSRQLAEGRLPHALLLSGPEDIGKARLALALARLLLCAAPSGGLNCGRCHACELSAAGNHGDLCWVQPEEKSRVIKIDQVRQAVSFAARTAGFGERKVVVLCPADSMNTNAANALLKALEEPAPGTYLLLVCHRLHGLPATIRSRCQINKLSIPGQGHGLSWLDTITGQRGESEALLQLANGRPLFAERIYREGGADALTASRAALAGVLCGRLPAGEASPLLADDAGVFLLQLQQALRELVRGQSSHGLRSRQGRAAFTLDEEISRLRAAIEAGANPNAQLLVESMLVRCQRELGGALLSDTM